MALWQIFSIVSVVAIILEIVIPSGFFLNFAVAGILTALLSLFVNSVYALIIDFIILAILSVWFIRPLLIKKKDEKAKHTGLDDKYIGKTAKVIEPITKTSGAITIYEERWDARTVNDEEIPVGDDVKILKNDSLILYVEKI